MRRPTSGGVRLVPRAVLVAAAVAVLVGGAPGPAHGPRTASVAAPAAVPTSGVSGSTGSTTGCVRSEPYRPGAVDTGGIAGGGVLGPDGDVVGAVGARPGCLPDLAAVVQIPHVHTDGWGR